MYGRSVGSPTNGHLVGGKRLEPTPYLRIVPVYEPGRPQWGLAPLVSMIDRAARSVRHQFPDAVTSVGHLSRQGGGEIDRHRSHESGRDADIGFFVHAAGQKPLLEDHFVPFRGDGTSPAWPGAHFDDARNWALVSALIADPEANVTHIFVATPLRARLLAYAEANGVPKPLRVRAAELLQQPRGSLPHDDHFHVRIGCPSHMDGCVELPAQRKASAHGPIAARPHLGTPTHALVTAPPHTEHPGRTAATANSDRATPSAVNPPPRPAQPAATEAASDQPAAHSALPDLPAASLPVYEDDVDGPSP